MTQAKKIIIVGLSASGKTTISKMMTIELGLPLISIDSHCFDDNWHIKPIDELLSIVNNLISGEKWIIDGLYQEIAEIFISKADIVVFIRVNIFKNMINVIKRKLNHIFHPTEDTYIGNKKRIRLENTRRVCFNRKEYFENWDRILNGLDHRTKLIRISDTKLNTRKKLIEKIKSM